MARKKTRIAKNPNRTRAEACNEVLSGARFDGQCWIGSGTRHPKGYCLYGRYVEGKQRNQEHQVVALYFLGERPDGTETIHTCQRGHEGCVSPGHLRYGTGRENQRMALESGVLKRAKLTPAKVREIRARCKSCTPTNVLADAFGVSTRTIQGVLNGEIWGWVEGVGNAPGQQEFFFASKRK